MLLAKVCRSTVPPQIKSFLKAPVVPKVTRVQAGRLFASDGRTVFQRTARKRTTIVEDAVAPAGQTGKYYIKQFILIIFNTSIT